MIGIYFICIYHFIKQKIIYLQYALDVVYVWIVNINILISDFCNFLIYDVSDALYLQRIGASEERTTETES